MQTLAFFLDRCIESINRYWHRHGGSVGRDWAIGRAIVREIDNPLLSPHTVNLIMSFHFFLACLAANLSTHTDILYPHFQVMKGKTVGFLICVNSRSQAARWLASKQMGSSQWALSLVTCFLGLAWLFRSHCCPLYLLLINNKTDRSINKLEAINNRVN